MYATDTRLSAAPSCMDHAKQIPPIGMQFYDKATALLQQFFISYREQSTPTGQLKYMKQIERISEHTSLVFTVELDDLLAFCKDADFTRAVVENALSFTKIIDAVVGQILRHLRPVPEGIAKHTSVKSGEDPKNAEGESGSTDDAKIHLVRPLEIQLVGLSDSSLLALRSLRASDLGRLVSIRGIITRLSAVKPRLQVAMYTCGSCGSHTTHDVCSASYYIPLSKCPSCGNQLLALSCLPSRGAKFSKHQEMRLQELAEQVPVGQTPRSIVAQCQGELTRQCAPGAYQSQGDEFELRLDAEANSSDSSNLQVTWL